jgi:hypothetical protein
VGGGRKLTFILTLGGHPATAAPIRPVAQVVRDVRRDTQAEQPPRPPQSSMSRLALSGPRVAPALSVAPTTVVCMTSQQWTPRCVLCHEPSVEELSVARQALDDDPRPGAPLCIEHRRLVVAGVAYLGWCTVGRHYSHHMDYCVEHKQLMLAP